MLWKFYEFYFLFFMWIYLFEYVGKNVKLYVKINVYYIFYM